MAADLVVPPRSPWRGLKSSGLFGPAVAFDAFGLAFDAFGAAVAALAEGGRACRAAVATPVLRKPAASLRHDQLLVAPDWWKRAWVRTTLPSKMYLDAVVHREAVGLDKLDRLVAVGLLGEAPGW